MAVSYTHLDVYKRQERGMVDPYDLRETCKSRFNEFLANNEDLILQDNVSNDIINEKRAELCELKKGVPFAKCDICFSEVNSLFENCLLYTSRCV